MNIIFLYCYTILNLQYSIVVLPLHNFIILNSQSSFLVGIYIYYYTKTIHITIIIIILINKKIKCNNNNKIKTQNEINNKYIIIIIKYIFIIILLISIVAHHANMDKLPSLCALAISQASSYAVYLRLWEKARASRKFLSGLLVEFGQYIASQRCLQRVVCACVRVRIVAKVSSCVL